MELTIEQIKAALEANPGLEKDLAALAVQTDSGKTILNNVLKTSNTDADKTYKEATKTAYENVEKALLDEGLEKPQGAKASEWAASIAKELKELQQKSKAKQQDADESAKLIEQIKLEAQQQVLEAQQQAEELKTQFATQTHQAQISSIALEFDETQSKEAVQALKSIVVNQMLSNSRVIDGRTVYFDGEKPMLDPKTMDYMSAEQVLKSKLAPVLAKAKQPGGGANITTDKTGTKVAGLNLQSTPKSRVEFLALFNKAATAQGIANGSEQYYSLYDKAVEQYSIYSLPES